MSTQRAFPLTHWGDSPQADTDIEGEIERGDGGGKTDRVGEEDRDVYLRDRRGKKKKRRRERHP